MKCPSCKAEELQEDGSQYWCAFCGVLYDLVRVPAFVDEESPVGLKRAERRDS